eukprot:CAMPEP_0175150516 /NCGR_PEP_ID=MMETSP0087-20121206/17937_1 /TAXON_ID=136419 /ORGANISM="Unknown Unknown, Strain D1" /LENGTH=475 /DNA_ID=CAMNT_0016436517 /DNA_START=21 /DNA_END=1448 /DNA_ORIENTATION=-
MNRTVLYTRLPQLLRASSRQRSFLSGPAAASSAYSTFVSMLAPRSPMNSLRFFSSYPDHIVLTMPALSPTMERGVIASWTKQPGDEVAAGQVMAEVETDKATVAFESVEEGFIAKILVDAGADEIEVGTPIAVLCETQEDVAKFSDFTAGASSSSSAELAAPTPEAAPAAPAAAAAPTTTKSSGDRVIATPYARLLARERGVDISGVTGTGPERRILAADVLSFTPSAAAPAAPAAPAAASAIPAAPTPGSGFTDIPHSNIRKVTAQRLTQSKQEIPHYYLSTECNVDNLLSVRAKLNANREKSEKVSVNDFIVKASALALKANPAVNSSWMTDSIREFDYVDISVAVSTPTGLITPIVKDADLKGLGGISSEIKELAGRARENKLQPHEFMGGTFTISNLGMFGVHSFSAIINPPQAAILAVGGSSKRLNVDGTESNVMNVTLSCDHRVIDGAVGAQWLKSFKSYIEDPMSMLL